jgi:prophage maintenance system killer protein
LIRPTLALAIALNHATRQDDEWFDEPDDLERVQRALDAVSEIEDPVRAAAIVAYRVARAQGFGEGNKRTAFLLAKWILDRNGLDGSAILPPDDRAVADLLVNAAAGQDVQDDLANLLDSRRG